MTCCKCEHPINITNYVENYDEPVNDGAVTYTVTDTGERQYHLGSDAYANVISHCPYCGESLVQEKGDNPDLSQYPMYLFIGAKQAWKNMSFRIKLRDINEYQGFQEAADDSVALSTAAAIEGITHTIRIAIISQTHKSKYRTKRLKREAVADVFASTLRNLGFQADNIEQIAESISTASVKLSDEELTLINERKEGRRKQS